MLMPAFRIFPEEAEIIGRLLAGYTELEIDLMDCVHVARDDLDATLKAMFRVRGETQRIGVADALGRHTYRKLKLDTEFGMAIGNMRFCLKIRNQYAHCNWYDDNSGALAFVNIEELADLNVHVTDLRSLTIHHVDVPTLEAQEAYFNYTMALLHWLNLEGRVLAGSLPSHTLTNPTQMTQPLLHIP